MAKRMNLLLELKQDFSDSKFTGKNEFLRFFIKSLNGMLILLISIQASFIKISFESSNFN